MSLGRFLPVHLTGPSQSAKFDPVDDERQMDPGVPASGGSATVATLTPATAELKRRLGVSPKPRMLTPKEIELLRKSAREVADVTRRVLATVGGDSHEA